MVELLTSGVDAYGIDLSPRTIRLARTKLIQADLNPRRFPVANVTRLPLADRQFDTVVSMEAIALFRALTQRAALTEMARVAGVEVRLLESNEKRPGW